MATSKTKGQRPKISEGPQVGAARYDAYKSTIDQYHKAMEADFYIEAIALMESIISDRIESMLNAILKNDDNSFNTSGHLADVAIHNATITQCRPIVDVLAEIKEWSKKRNDAIHKMAKLSHIEIEKSISFSDKYAALEEVAQEGYSLFNKLNNELKSARRKKILP